MVPEWYQTGIFNHLGEETQRRLCRQLGLPSLSPTGALKVERKFHSERPGLCTVYKETFLMQSLVVNGSICFCVELHRRVYEAVI